MNEIKPSKKETPHTENKQSGSVNISEVNDSDIDVGNIITGTVEGDAVAGDKVGGDKVIGNKIEHHHYNVVADASEPKEEKPPQPFEPEMIDIPAGLFLMGSDTGNPNEAPQHEVDLPTYRIGKYPITNSQYAEFVKRNFKEEYVPIRVNWFIDEPPEDKLNYPVTGISWSDAKAYCDWLTNETGRTYRLPTEAEWEKAARGTDGRAYPWGNEWDANRCNQGGDSTTPVTSDNSPTFPDGVSTCGCYDMAGNVQEWTNTIWGSDENKNGFPYPYDPKDGREASDANNYMVQVYRVYRGGSFADKLEELRCSWRGCSDQNTEVSWRGFRVVLEV